MFSWRSTHLSAFLSRAELGMFASVGVEISARRWENPCPSASVRQIDTANNVKMCNNFDRISDLEKGCK